MLTKKHKANFLFYKELEHYASRMYDKLLFIKDLLNFSITPE